MRKTKILPDLLSLENSVRLEGYSALAGIDEAGRGPLAGPVVAAAVILPCNCVIEGLDDSKKLTAKKREDLFGIIQAAAVAHAIGWATVFEIDEKNILQATFLAMRRAIKGLSVLPDMCLIDGNQAEIGITLPAWAIVSGDAKSQSIAAASILAKVTRDRVMDELHEKHPAYGFDRHRGYGTAAHYAALDTHGVSPVHRRSFLKKWEAKR